MIKKLTFIGLWVGLFGLMGCQNPTPTQPVQENQGTKLGVTVSILPQQYFVERIGGDHVEVNVMVTPGASPELYEPKPEQLRALANSEVYFTVGPLPFEKTWLERISSANENMFIVDTSQGIELETMEHHHHGEEEKGDKHGEENVDPHIWLSPKLVKKQANTIYETLVKEDSKNATEYKTNLDKFIADIEKLDQEIKEKLNNINNRKFLVFHPTWGYFAKDYNLEMLSIEIDGREPSAQELANIIKEGKEENIKVVFTQPEFSTTTAETLAKQLNAEVFLMSPLAPNWLENMREMSEKMSQALTK